MPVVQFMGRVFPHAAQVSTSNIPQINWTPDDGNPSIITTIQINHSFVHVSCEIDQHINDERMSLIYSHALDLAKATVDLIAFRDGVSLFVVLDSLINCDGKLLSNIMFHPERHITRISLVNSLATTPIEGNSFDKVLKIIIREPQIFIALHDLIESISQRHSSIPACARAIESIRHNMSPDTSRRGQAWAVMNARLRIDRTYTDYITSHSRGPRHGDPTHISGEITTEIVSRSWKIMDRFLEYKKRGGSQPLPSSEFTMLV